ncbi:MAG: hypothetical protein FJY21_04920 [Bacteroidetes bacterium]|nr:hypothetical protein [Bacteroidota bacterium]
MRKFVYSITILVLLFGLACNRTEKPVEALKVSISVQNRAEAYPCHMHAEIKSDKPGSCSICKMDLVKDSTNQMDSLNNSHTHKH